MPSSGKKAIELIVRGVWIEKSRILLCRSKGASNTFLPGGHIEFCEQAQKALPREITEELGIEIEIGDFLGVVEHTWQGDASLNHEINLIFQMYGPNSNMTQSSRERHLEFLWHPVDDLAAVNLEPSVLGDLLPEWLSSKNRAGWGTTIS